MAHSSGAAAPTLPAFNLIDVQHMLHQHAYGGDRRNPAMATREQYTAFCQQLHYGTYAVAVRLQLRPSVQ